MLHCTTITDILHNFPQICQHLTQISMRGVAALLPHLTKINLFVTGALEVHLQLTWKTSGILPKTFPVKGKRQVHAVNWSAFLVLWIGMIFVSVELKTYQKVHLSTGLMHLPDFLSHTENLILNTDSEINVD